MSLRKNILTNFASQIYVTFVGIVVVPMYVRYMGAEAYGLVGFLATIQVWFGLLDMGLSLTLVRETARLRGNTVEALTYRNFVRALELVFVGIGVAGGAFLFFSSTITAKSWLHVEHLDLSIVVKSLELISVAVVMRWMAGFYRGIATGAEQFYWLGAFNAVIATLRFVGVLPLLILVSNSPIVFFSYQCAIGIVELLGLFTKARSLMPALPDSSRLTWSLKSMYSSVRRTIAFSIGISFASVFWVMMTQVDKLLLSRLLSLTDFGFFTLSVLAASGVSIVAGPLASVLMPRLASLHAQGRESELILLYRRMTRGVVVMVAPVSLLLAVFSEQILFAWTGGQAEAKQGAPILCLYALGNGVLSVASFPFYLQYAKGVLRLHMVGSCLFMAIYIPVLLALTRNYGGVGAGYAWLGVNVCYLLLWTPIVHGHFAKGCHLDWLVSDVIAPAISSVVVLLTASALMSIAEAWPTERISLIIFFVVLGGLTMVIAIMSQSGIRSALGNYLKLARSKYSNGKK